MILPRGGGIYTRAAKKARFPHPSPVHPDGSPPIQFMHEAHRRAKQPGWTGARARNRRAALRLCFKPAPEGSRASRSRRSVTRSAQACGAGNWTGPPGKNEVLFRGKDEQRSERALPHEAKRAMRSLRGRAEQGRETEEPHCGSVSSPRRREAGRCAGAGLRHLGPGYKAPGAAYSTYTRGTRSETAQSSSYCMVPARSAAASTVTVSPPSLP